MGLAYKLAASNNFRTVIIENPTNDGVAKGNNLGIRKALDEGCECVLISNNDITLENNTIEELLSGLQSTCASMTAPKIYFAGTRSFWYAGGYFHKRSGLNLHRGLHQHDDGQFDKQEPVGFAPTCFLLVRKDVFDQVGMMDEQYFVYWDDTDFIYRAVVGHGKSLWYIPSAVVHHKEGTSTGYMSDFSIRYQYRNLAYFAWKNYSHLYACYVVTYNIALHGFKHLFRWPFSKWMLGMVFHGRI